MRVQKSMIRTAVVLLLLTKAIFSPGIVQAARQGAMTPQGAAVLSKWKSTDQRAKTAQNAFPDYTPDANAKREAALQACLAQGTYHRVRPLHLSGELAWGGERIPVQRHFG